MNDIEVFKNLNDKIIFVCVSKYHTTNEIQKAINYGFENFGESKLQDLEKKRLYFKENINIKWHFIGRLQSNKIKKIVLNSYLIHSVSKLKHLEKINFEANKINKIQKILLQINLTNEVEKDGFTLEDFNDVLKNINSYKNIKFEGIMVIGPHTTNVNEIDNIFYEASKLFNELKNDYPINTLSMGMSNDYPIALKYNSNCLRIGSKFFESIQ